MRGAGAPPGGRPAPAARPRWGRSRLRRPPYAARTPGPVGARAARGLRRAARARRLVEVPWSWCERRYSKRAHAAFTSPRGRESYPVEPLARVRLRFGSRAGKGRQALEVRADRAEPRVSLTVDLVAARVVHLRHDA